MKLRSYLTFTIAFLPWLTSLQAQDDADKILRQVYTRLAQAKDYSVKANIQVDIPFIRILPVDVTIYFREDDKFKVESHSIAVVPRQGFDQIKGMLDDAGSYTAVIQGEENLGDVTATIVNVIPLSDTSELVLGKLWVDPRKHVILKSQLTTRTSGTIVTEYSYGSQLAYGLPDKMIFFIDTSKFRMPKAITDLMNKSNTGQTTATGDKVNSRENGKGTGKGNGKGKITILLSGYKVNQGIPDSIFAE